MTNNSLLTLHLDAFVPVEIKMLQNQGGPTDWHIEEAQRRLGMYREKGGESFFYTEGFKPGETAQAIGVLVECLAVLAFTPGGVTVFGCHFQAEERDAARKQVAG